MNLFLKVGVLLLGLSVTFGSGPNGKTLMSPNHKQDIISLTVDEPLMAVQTVHNGTASDPYTVEDALKIAKSLNKNQEFSKEVYVTGIVDGKPSKDKHGRLNLYLKDDGKTDTFYVYGINNIGGKPSFKNNDVETGDTLVCKGGIKNYNNKLELCFISGKANCEIISITKPSVTNNEVKFNKTAINAYSDSQDEQVSVKVGTDFGTNPSVTWSVPVGDGTIISLAKKTGLDNTIHYIGKGEATIKVSVTNSSGTIPPVEATLKVTVGPSALESANSIAECKKLSGTNILGRGVVSAIQGTEGIFVSDLTTGDGMLLYKANFKNINVGDEIVFKGEITTYEDVKQFKDVSLVLETPVSKNNKVTPIQVKSLNDIKNNASSLVELKGAVLLENGFASASSSSESTSKFKLGNDTIPLFSKKSTFEAAKSVSLILKDGQKNQSCYDIIAIAGVHNNKGQLILVNDPSVTLNNYASLIQTLMGENKEGQCNTKYQIAKEYYLACTEEEQQTFRTSSETLDARTRYEAWARNQGSNPYEAGELAKDVNIISDTNILITIIVSVAVLGITAISLLVISKKRKMTK